MYIVNNKTNFSKWEVNSLDDLIFELDVLNVKTRRKAIEENLVIYKTKEDGEVIDEITLKLPTEENIDNLFESFLTYENKKEELNVDTEETKINEDVYDEDLTDDERQVLNNISVYPTPEENRNKIIEKLNQNYKKEVITQKEQELNERERELEKREFEIKNKVEKQTKEYQVPVNNNNNQTTIYEGISIKSTDELTDIFKNTTIAELKKVEEQIYLLNRTADKYRKLLKKLDEVSE